MKIKIKGIEELRKKLNDTNWTKIAKDAMEDAMRDARMDAVRSTELLPRPVRQAKKKGRKYWKQMAQKYYRLWRMTEICDLEAREELSTTKKLLAISEEQLQDEIRGRDTDKCKLDEIQQIHDAWRADTRNDSYLFAHNAVTDIGYALLVKEDIAKDPAPSYKDARGAIPHKGTERPAEDIINDLRSGDSDATKELLAIREEQLLDEISAHENECEPELIAVKKLAAEQTKMLDEFRNALDQAEEEARISSKKSNIDEPRLDEIYDEWIFAKEQLTKSEAKLREIRETYEVTMEHGREDPHDAGCCYFAGMSQIGGIFKSVGEVLDDIGKRL